jgi:hypothetical protein
MGTTALDILVIPVVQITLVAMIAGAAILTVIRAAESLVERLSRDPRHLEAICGGSRPSRRQVVLADLVLESPVMLVSGLSVVLSNLVSNVPAVLLFKPLMEVIPQREQAWLALSMSSTLAGNLTVLGSVANLIVVESARRWPAVRSVTNSATGAARLMNWLAVFRRPFPNAWKV